MKIELNISEDKEIRKEVNALIVGQVNNMVRSDFHALVSDELKRMLPTISHWQLPSLQNKIDQAIINAVNKLVSDRAKELGFTNEYITDLINKRVETALEGNDWKSIVDSVAKEKIKALVG